MFYANPKYARLISKTRLVAIIRLKSVPSVSLFADPFKTFEKEMLVRWRCTLY